MNSIKTDLINLRNKLYDSLPVGVVDSFELLKVIEEHIKELDKIIEQSESHENKINEAVRLLSTPMCTFDTKQELLDWSIKQQNTFITYMVTAYLVLVDGKYERFKGDGHLGIPVEGSDMVWG